MKIACWYNSGSLRSFCDFCFQNQDKPVSIKLIDRSEPVGGTVYSHNTDPNASRGIFILLTQEVVHPAFYCFEDIESLRAETAAIEANA